MKTKVDLLRNRKTESIVGIDVGTNSIKAVELSHGGKSTRLVAYADLDNNISANITPQSLCSNILKLLETPILGDFKANKINLSLPRHIGHNHFASLEIENNNDIDKAMQRFVASKLNLNPKDYYLDYHPIGIRPNAPNSTRLYMVEIIDLNFYNNFKKYIELGRFKLSSLNSSTARQLSNIRNHNSEASMLIDIGQNITRAYFCNGNSCIDRIIDLGGSNITNKISRVLKISSHKAMDLQKKVGISGSELANKINLISSDELSLLARNIRQFAEDSADIFDIHNLSDINIFITGSIVSMQGFLESLRNQSSLNVNILNPWAKTSLYPLKPIPKSRLPKFSGAIALAYR